MSNQEKVVGGIMAIVSGIVKLLNVSANGCQTLYNSVMHKGKTRNWQENACYNYESGTWRIY